MENFTVYNKYTGKIIRTGSCTKFYIDTQAILPFEHVIAQSSNYSTDYVDINTGLILPLLGMNVVASEIPIASDGMDPFVLSGLPIPCTVVVDEQEFEIDDGEFSFSTPLPGIYQVTVKAFPYLEKTWEVVAE